MTWIMQYLGVPATVVVAYVLGALWGGWAVWLVMRKRVEDLQAGMIRLARSESGLRRALGRK